MENYSAISEKVDSAKFFKGLSVFFQDASTLFIEGNSIAKIPMDCYKKNLEEGDYLPTSGTIFPKSHKLRCKYSTEFMNELSVIAENQAEPELFDHFHLYKGNEPIVIWKDAFSDEMYISNKMPRETVDKFSKVIKEDK